MVRDEAPPSRAASLTLVGGELALDFANTSSGRGGPTHVEHLRTAGDVADWAAHARVLPPEDAQWLNSQIRADPATERELIGAALALREDIYRLAAEIAAGRSPPPEPIERLARAHANCLLKARLAPFEGRYAFSWTTRETPIEAVLGPISLSAMTTLLQADLTRIKQCRGEKCGWLFLDATKNKSRRWCEMEVCGNRAKQKRLAQRARGL